jgi:hypothetical protein
VRRILRDIYNIPMGYFAMLEDEDQWNFIKYNDKKNKYYEIAEDNGAPNCSFQASKTDPSPQRNSVLLKDRCWCLKLQINCSFQI